MSRGSVFKLSGNMAINSNMPYPNTEIDQIKNSLKLLKAKQGQRQDSLDAPHGYGQSAGYGNPSPHPASEGVPKRNDRHNLEYIGKANIPSREADYPPRQNGYDRSSKRANERPPSYPNQAYEEQGYERPAARNERQGQQGYERPGQGYERQGQGQGYERQGQGYQHGRANQYEKPVSTGRQEDDSRVQRQVSRKPAAASQQAPNRPIRNRAAEFETEHESKPIQALKQENRLEIDIKYSPNDFVQCSAGCGRSFNPESISKHEAVCKKVFQRKRKEFDSQKNRLVAKEQVKLMKKGEEIERKIEMSKQGKAPKWEQQSMAFRAMLKQGTGKKLTAEDQRLIQHSKQAEMDSAIHCPHCGRTFNETAGPRHITFCEAQQKKLGNKRKR